MVWHPLDARGLGRHTGDRESVLEELRRAATTEEVLAGRHVVPLHDHRAVEVGRTPWTQHEHPCPERPLVDGLDVPPPVRRVLGSTAGEAVPRGGTLEEVFLLDAADLLDGLGGAVHRHAVDLADDPRHGSPSV